MFWQNLSRFDRVLVIGASLVMLLSSGLIFEDRWIFKLLSREDKSLERIGNTKTAVNDVRRRHSTALSWLPLDQGNSVFQGDSIFTGDQSEAVITTDRGEQISISPNSLVVINMKTDTIRLDIDYGSVLGQVGKSKKLQIASGGDVTEFKGDDAMVKVDVGSDKNVKVNVLEGQVEIVSGEGSRVLGPAQQAEIGEAGSIVEPSEVQIELLSPVASRILKPEESRDLILSWRSSFNFKDYQIELSKDSDFKNILLKESVARTLYRPAGLPTNTKIYWRVSSKVRPELEPTKSAVSDFVIAEDIPPVIDFPTDRQRITFEEQPGDGGKEVQLVMRWSTRTISWKWEVQLAQSSDFLKGVKPFEAVGGNLNLGGLNEGNYFLRMRARDWKDGKWSSTVAFSVFKRPTATLRPPAVVTAENEFFLITKSSTISEAEIRTATKETLINFVDSVPELAWNNIPGATSYELEISTERDFGNVEQRVEVPNTRFPWVNVRLGQFFWRIRSISAGNRKGTYTQPQPLAIRLAPPTSLTDEKVTEEVTSMAFMDAAPPPFLIRWVPTLFTAGYELQFDRDEKFVKPLTIITMNTFKKVQAPQTGVYYWRVRSLNLDSKPVSDWTKTQKFEYARNFVSPENSKELKALYPNDDTVMLIGKGEIKINFTWTAPVKTAKYHFQLSPKEDFSELRLDFTTDKNSHLFKENLVDGWHYWRVRAETPQFTSPWTKVASFQIKHETNSFNFITSEKVQEKENKRLEEARSAQEASDAKARAEFAAEEMRVNESLKPLLDQPEELDGPEKFSIEYSAIPNNTASFQALSDNEKLTYVRRRPVLEWRPISEATEYRVQFAKDLEFKNIVDSAKTNRPSMSWVRTQPGANYWRVQALSPKYRPSPFSEARRIEIEINPPVLVSPNALAATQSSAGNTISLQWSPVPFAASYEVELGSDATFTTKSVNRVATFYSKQNIEKEGTYYWRVTALDKKGQRLTRPSAARPVTVGIGNRIPSAADYPVLKFPAMGQVISVVQGDAPRIGFSWTSVPINGIYVLQVARDPEFNQLVVQEPTKKDEITVDLTKVAQEFYWRLKITRQGQTIWISPTRKLIIRKEQLMRETASDQSVTSETAPADAAQSNARVKATDIEPGTQVQPTAPQQSGSNKLVPPIDKPAGQ